MSEQKWTAGKWRAGEDGWRTGNGVVFVMQEKSGQPKTIATIGGWGDEQKANANLIAAAPALYETLSDLAKLLPKGSIGRNMALRALAQAEGKT